MKCPHCNVAVHVELASKAIVDARDENREEVRWHTSAAVCPNCTKAIIYLTSKALAYTGGMAIPTGVQRVNTLVWPRSGERPCPTEVPTELQKDYREAANVLSISPQASAALTRRVLQHVLREYAKTKSKDLFDQIQEILDENQLPSSLQNQLDAVRVIGNFAAHPLKSQQTGLILPVEEHEAEWNLDVLDHVFDYYFVKPAQAQTRREALNKKLVEAGKKPI
jgi:uncharacterized protein DUF4145